MIIGTVVLAIMVALVLVIIGARVLVLVFTKHQEGRTHFADNQFHRLYYASLQLKESKSLLDGSD